MSDNQTHANLQFQPLPESGRPDRVKRFKDYSQTVLDGWDAQKAAPSQRRAESPNAWFKREAYRLLAHCLAHNVADIFVTIAHQDGRPSRLVQEATKNPFKLGLLAMFADDSPLSRMNRHVFGNQMLYAWRHDVPPEFLNGFLAISGGHEVISAKLKANNIEPGFEHRYKQEREKHI